MILHTGAIVPEEDGPVGRSTNNLGIAKAYTSHWPFRTREGIKALAALGIPNLDGLVQTARYNAELVKRKRPDTFLMAK